MRLIHVERRQIDPASAQSVAQCDVLKTIFFGQSGCQFFPNRMLGSQMFRASAFMFGSLVESIAVPNLLRTDLAVERRPWLLSTIQQKLGALFFWRGELT